MTVRNQIVNAYDSRLLYDFSIDRIYTLVTNKCFNSENHLYVKILINMELSVGSYMLSMN